MAKRIVALLVFALAPLALAQTRQIPIVVRIESGCSVHAQPLPVELRHEENQDIWTGTTQLTYLLRTSKSAGGGAIHAQLRNFPEEISGSLHAEVSTDGPGTPVAFSGLAGSQPVPLLVFGNNQHSPKEASHGSIRWELSVPSGTLASPPDLDLDIECR